MLSSYITGLGSSSLTRRFAESYWEQPMILVSEREIQRKGRPGFLFYEILDFGNDQAYRGRLMTAVRVVRCMECRRNIFDYLSEEVPAFAVFDKDGQDREFLGVLCSGCVGTKHIIYMPTEAELKEFLFLEHKSVLSEDQASSMSPRRARRIARRLEANSSAKNV